MAVDTVARDALLAALQDGTGAADLADFLAWAQSLLDMNQMNSEVRAELKFFTEQE